MEERTNEQDALAYQAGDKEAISRLWERNRGVIYRTSYSCFAVWGRDKCAACGVELDDLVQEAFFALCEAAEAFDPGRGFKFLSWLKFPLRNHFNALLGMRGKPSPLNYCDSLDVPTASQDGSEDGRPQDEIIPDVDAEAAFWSAEDREFNRQLHAALDEAMDALTEQQRDVLQWRYYDNLTLQEIADRRHCSTEYARQLNRKAISRLRQGQARRILRPFAAELGAAYNGVGFGAWNHYGSIEERLVERAEARAERRREEL